jgi:hypothetical protein
MEVKQQLIQFGRQWDEAIANNNVEEISKFMSADWVIVGTEGGITSKSDFLDTIISGDLVHTKMDFQDIHVKSMQTVGS